MSETEKETKKTPKQNFCYILYNEFNNSTYNGFTNDLTRRLRQHNCEIKGGAKFTTRRVAKYAHNQSFKWKYLAIITSQDAEFTKNKALSLEWSIKYPTNRRPRPKEYNTPQGRLDSLQLVFCNPKFSGLLIEKRDILHDTISFYQHGQLQITDSSIHFGNSL